MIPLDNTDLKIVIRTFAGLEETLAAEILSIGGRNIKELTRAVSCTGDLGFVYKANFALRTAINILVPVFEFKAGTEDEFYKQLSNFAWEDYQSVNQTFLIQAVIGGSSVFNHTLYLAQKTKDALADRFNRLQNKRPSVSKTNPDLYYTIHADDDRFTLSLDSSGEILFKRGYRQTAGEAPLNEVLGAAIVLASGWNPPRVLYNPMCGSGTIAIEAALIQTKVPPGVFREKFAFMEWPGFNKELFTTISEGLINRITDNEYLRIICSDITKKAIVQTRENAEAAKVEDFLEVEQCDFFASEAHAGIGTVIINPPYNERMEIADVEAFYAGIGSTLKHKYAGCTAWVFTAWPDAVKHIGLRPSRKIKLFNGSLECKLLRYDLYEGSKRRSDS